jgi:hypothetical protein
LLPWCNALCLLHPTVLPQGERGCLPWCNALRLLHPTRLLAPNASPARGEGNCYRGRLRFANRPYSTLLVPGPGAVGNPVEGGTLAPWRGAGCRADIRQRRYRPWLSLPQCAADPGIGQKGPTGTHPHPTEPTGPDPWILLTQVSESTGFLRWFNVTAARLGWGGASGVTCQSVNGPIFPQVGPISPLSGVSRVG